MTLLAIRDDLFDRTLANIPGVLGKLGYIADLRQEKKYVHWGLERVYGEDAVQRTMVEVHRGLFLQVLRTPLRQLLEDAARSAAAQECGVRTYLQGFLREARPLAPPNLGRGSEAHFSSVVEALLSLLP